MNNPALDKFAVTIGFITAFSGAEFRLLVIGLAYIKRGGKNGKVYADNLVTQGAYAHVRNPMYIGNFLIILGMGIIYGSIYVYLIVIPFFIFVYLSIIAAEENYLQQHFGAEYQQYRQRTPGLIPNFSGIRKTFASLSFDWKKSLRKDYGTLIGTIMGVYVLFLWKLHFLYGFPRNKSQGLKSGVIFLLILACYVFLRVLKKTGRLKSNPA